MKSILLVKKFLGLVEMTSGLVNASFSLPKWQAVKMIFFAPCTVTCRCNIIVIIYYIRLFSFQSLALLLLSQKVLQ